MSLVLPLAAAAAPPEIFQNVYSVHDLVTRKVPPGPAEPGLTGAVAACFSNAEPDDPTANGINLVRLITRTIRPDSWDRFGGVCSLNYYPIGMALVATQTREGHEEISELLAALRSMIQVRSDVQVRLVTMPESDFHEAANELGLRSKSARPDGPVYLSAEEAERLIRFARSRPGATVLAAPRLVLHDGQSGGIDLDLRNDGTAVSMSDTPGDLAFRVKSVVSGDRESVRLGVQFRMRLAADPAKGHSLALETKLVVPNGGTAMIGSWTTRRPLGSPRSVTLSDGPNCPAAGSCPAVARPARIEPEAILLLVTPTVLE